MEVTRCWPEASRPARLVRSQVVDVLGEGAVHRALEQAAERARCQAHQISALALGELVAEPALHVSEHTFEARVVVERQRGSTDSLAVDR